MFVCVCMHAYVYAHTHAHTNTHTHTHTHTGVVGANRWVAVKDKSGEFRPATFEERYRAERIIAPIRLPRT